MKEQVIRACKASRLGEALFGHIKNMVTHMGFSINVDKIVKALVAKDVTAERYAEAKAGASTRDKASKQKWTLSGLSFCADMDAVDHSAICLAGRSRDDLS
eukprot:5679315-Amphidinium_carterae.1